MVIKMKNEELGKIYTRLEKCNNLRGVKLAYAIAKNKMSLEKELKTLQKVNEPSNDFKTYLQKRRKLLEKYCEKDENGNLKTESIPNGIRYVGVEKNKDFQKELKKLMSDNMKLIKKQTDKDNEYQRFLQEESDLELHKIDFKMIPEDITVEQMEALTPMVKE